MPFIAPIVAAAVTAATAVSSFVAAAGFIGQVLIAGGLSIATSYLIKQLSPKPEGAGLQGGVQLDHRYGMDQPRQVAIGLCGVAGHDVLMYTFNPSNRDYHQVFVLSDYYTTALTRVAIGGKYVAVGAPDPSRGNWQPINTPPYLGFVWIKFYDGKQTAADPTLVLFSNPVDKWTADCVGKGVSYVAVQVSYEANDVNSFLDFFFEFQGAPLYDPRFDDSVGGVGDQRYDDPATHSYSENPMVAAYHYRRGFYIDDDVFCGMGMDADDLPLEQWFTAMNVCSEIVDDNARYRVSALMNAMANHGDNLKTLSLAAGAMDVDDLGQAYPIVGTAQASVITFTDDDLISIADNFRYTAKVSSSELVNSVAGNYCSPDELWSPVGYEPQIDAAAIVLDRRTRDVNIDFPQVPYKDQAEQLASIYLQENRLQASATVTLRPRFQVVQVGDWVDWQSDRYGWTKTFVVTGKGLLTLDGEAPRNAVLSLKERDGAIYDAITPVPFIPSVPNADPEFADEVDDFAAIPVSVQGSTGHVAPGIRVSWTIPDDVTIIGVDLIYYPTAQATAINYKSIDRDTTVVVLTDVVANTEYTVKAKILTSPSRLTVYNAGVTVTTSDLAITIGQVDEAITQRLIEMQDQHRSEIDLIKAKLSSIVANQESRNWIDKKRIRTQLFAISEDAFAQIEEVRTVAVDTETAWAAYELALTAQYGGAVASVSTVASSIATFDGYAAAQYAVTLNVNGYATGFNLVNGGGGISAFTVVADKFQIQLPSYNSNNPYSVFTTGLVNGVASVGINGNLYLDGTFHARSIIAGTITGTLIQAGAINTTQLAVNGVDIVNILAGAATAQDTITHTGFGPHNSTTPANITSVLTMTIKGGTAHVVWSTNARVNNIDLGTNDSYDVKLYVDGAAVWTWEWLTYSGDAPRGDPVTLSAEITGLSNASHTFQLKGNSISGHAELQTLGSGTLTVKDLRK